MIAYFFGNYTDKLAHLGCAFVLVCAGALPRRRVLDGVAVATALSFAKEIADSFSVTGFDWVDIAFNTGGTIMAYAFIELWERGRR